MPCSICCFFEIHHGDISSLEALLLSNGFTVPPQLDPLEFSMEILTDLQPPEQLEQELEKSIESISPPPIEHKIRSRSSRIHEITLLSFRFWKMIYRTKQLLVTNTLQAIGVGIVLDTIYINIGLDKSGIEKRLGLFAYTLTFPLSSTTETLPIFINERPILLREASSGVYRLSSCLIANTLVFIPYLLAMQLSSLLLFTSYIHVSIAQILQLQFCGKNGIAQSSSNSIQNFCSTNPEITQRNDTYTPVLT